MSIRYGVENSEPIFIAVPTPPEKDGSVNPDFIEQVAREIAEVTAADRYRVIVDKSTVPVKTGEKVAETIRRYNKVNANFDVVSNPEFLHLEFSIIAMIGVILLIGIVKKTQS